MLSSTDLVQAVAADLEKIRETAPLVLSLTNSVVQPLTANLLLAIGAVPAMLNDAEEAADMLRNGTGALLVNLGTVTREQGAAMQTAVREANRLNIPWVMDPVAVGALSLRTRLAGQLKEQSPRIIRGNASEIMALAGYSSVMKGPESTSSSADALHAARELALHTGAAVLVTGRTDYSTDGRQVIATENGHAMMSRVTGVGCSMGALSAACAAVSPTPLQAAVSTAVLMGIAGEMAFEQSPAPGSFAVSLLDSLYSLLRKTLSVERAFFPFNRLPPPWKVTPHSYGLILPAPEEAGASAEAIREKESSGARLAGKPAPCFQALRPRSRKQHPGDLPDPATAVCLSRPPSARTASGFSVEKYLRLPIIKSNPFQHGKLHYHAKTLQLVHSAVERQGARPDARQTEPSGHSGGLVASAPDRRFSDQ